MTPQKPKDLLLELCQPYLFDLAALLVQSLKYDEEPIHELTDGRTNIPGHVLGRMNSLTYSQKAAILLEIAHWVDSVNTNQTINDNEIIYAD